MCLYDSTVSLLSFLLFCIAIHIHHFKIIITIFFEYDIRRVVMNDVNTRYRDSINLTPTEGAVIKIFDCNFTVSYQ